MEKMQELERKLQEALLRNRELELKNTFLRSDNNQLQSNVDKLQSDIDGLQTKLTKLGDELLYLRRTLFGRSSERYIKEDPNQLSLDFYGLVQLEEEKNYLNGVAKRNLSARDSGGLPVKRHPVRKPLPEHLERRREVIEPCSLPEGAKCIGQEVTEILEYIPGQLYVREIIRKKYALPGGIGIIMAELPSLPLPRSNAGASLLANLLISKYQDHQPYYRQLEMFKRSGVHLAASTVNDWSASSINLLEPLYKQLKKNVLGSDYIQVDETTIPVLDKDKPGATRKGYHWVVRSPENEQLFFHYDKGSRAQYVVVDLLKDFKGTVQSDGYGAYDIYEKKQDVLLLGCWAHARRKFEQALGNDPPRAEYALEQIGKLYQLEQRATDNNFTKGQIEALRKEKAYPILRDFEKWIDKNYPQVLPSSKIGKAMSYTYGIYQRLARYVLDGRYRIDNNLAENAVRPLALGRKNYLFCSNHQSAERTAMIYSLLGTCKICGINPSLWLTDVLNRIQDHSIQELDELLPGKWRPQSLINRSEN
ncbi:IS66 family transposase [Dysgonomonas sp. 25]|uniref:IS66 family transposase n=1 Tax=Dysgonomonas sp. 25 TaxID=2302933 RepID=UPI0013CF8D8B|nr:IS66 family transposase [Dysgonomonas sp. 25]NDV67357.1 IS66 family transposase [Dysgonomonas sp. 25]